MISVHAVKDLGERVARKILDALRQLNRQHPVGGATVFLLLNKIAGQEPSKPRSVESTVFMAANQRMAQGARQ